ncbi:protein JASON-like isoform X1 [Canna indica]|uniref:Protein JASON-like isoform X1 n=1 Tax=Canna indica TaxID=4628 RepID=A0AAQ3JMP4_9LILI|nr:protein JASON-like isoform X1 [Canna indica]
MNQAQLLKACGAILQTPPEIRKTSGTVQDPVSGAAPSSFISETSDSSYKKIFWDEKHELSRYSVEVQDNRGLSRSNRQSSTSEHQVMQKCECSSPSVRLSKSEGFESDIEPKWGCHTPDISLSQHKSHIHPLASKCSPFSTPLKVTGEMQTPATVYSTNLDNNETRKNTLIRTQYVYPVLNPVEDQRRELLSEYSLEPLKTRDSFDERPDCIPDSKEKIQQVSHMSEPEDIELSANPSPTSPSDKIKQKYEIIYTDKYISERTPSLETPIKNSDETPYGPEQVVTSLSQWLKPPVADDGYNEIKGKPFTSKSSDVDRPILGMVAAHWKDEPERISPKQWDGNGIPNSTNKYKEDQKVHWHATPFEERLEKALSDENFLPKRKFHCGKPLDFEEGELADTAAS